ncbi:MAG: CRISPR-associated protein Cas5 [candidate division WOR-3 bacterium]|nr:CRISPR-associated protein Cas5 [candidate division WOR-3 bacterium]
MKGLSFEVEGLYFVCFRKPTSTSTILTYPLPPFTTIRGFLANALGWDQDSYYRELRGDSRNLLYDLRIGIEVVSHGESNSELAKILKLIPRTTGYQRSFPSAPMHREFLVKPRYRIYLTGEDSVIGEISQALTSPQRPLYLGQSDDMLDYTEPHMVEVEETESAELDSIAEGVHRDCDVLRLPHRFVPEGDGWSLEYLLVSVPKKRKLKATHKVECLRFEEKFVAVY